MFFLKFVSSVSFTSKETLLTNMSGFDADTSESQNELVQPSEDAGDLVTCGRD